MTIEDRLSVTETEKRLGKKDIPCCRNCEHYYKPICMLWVTNQGHLEVGENDWCEEWEKDN